MTRRMTREARRARHLAKAVFNRTCIYCGCTSERACPGGCQWAAMSPPRCDAPDCLAEHERVMGRAGRRVEGE